MGFTTIVGIEDLSGDGQREAIVVGRPAIVAVVDLSDGRVVWRSERTDFGAPIDVVRLAQFSPGGPLELFAADRMGGDTFSRRDAMYPLGANGAVAAR